MEWGEAGGPAFPGPQFCQPLVSASDASWEVRLARCAFIRRSVMGRDRADQLVDFHLQSCSLGQERSGGVCGPQAHGDTARQGGNSARIPPRVFWKGGLHPTRSSSRSRWVSRASPPEPSPLPAAVQGWQWGPACGRPRGQSWEPCTDLEGSGGALTCR